MQFTARTYLTLSSLLLAISSTAATSFNALEARNPAMTYVGCFSKSGATSDGTDWTYQSTGWCQDHCIASSSPAFALSGGDTCICSDYLPETSSKADDSKCSDPCTGWPDDNCGGAGYYSVYKSGLDNSVSTKPEASSNNTNSDAATNGTTTASTGTNSGPTQVVTSTVDPQSAAAAAEEAEHKKDAGAHNTASIAAGVVVGVVGVAALAGAIFFWLRHRRQKSPGFSRSHMPEMGDARYDGGYITNRRPSEDSIDYPDFSRHEVLQVTNPDRL